MDPGEFKAELPNKFPSRRSNYVVEKKMAVL